MSFTKNKYRIVCFCIVLMGLLFIGFGTVFAIDTTDTDGDGISDYHEREKYLTDPFVKDTDGDSFDDGVEIRSGYNPLARGKTLRQSDTDGDGLSDDLELAFGTKINVMDTDSDGYDDKSEIDNGYDPLSQLPNILKKHIEVSIKEQSLSYFLGGVRLGSYRVSTGKNNSTPRGDFKIGKKIPRAWSGSARLWMPYWMPFDRHLYGLHELPEWPNGVKEGVNHLGKPVSGGCIRLGVGDAKALYEWAPEGTLISIK